MSLLMRDLKALLDEAEDCHSLARSVSPSWLAQPYAARRDAYLRIALRTISHHGDAEARQTAADLFWDTRLTEFGDLT